MALLDNMYAPYSHLMQRFNSAPPIPEDPSITKLDITSNTNEVIAHNRGHYGGVMTMKLEQRSYGGQENNINEDNRKDSKVWLFYIFLVRCRFGKLDFSHFLQNEIFFLIFKLRHSGKKNLNKFQFSLSSTIIHQVLNHIFPQT